MTEHEVQREDLPEDSELVRRTLAGDPQAFEALFHRYRGLVFVQALRWLGNSDAADDVVQDVFIAAYHHMDRLRIPAAFAGWIARITRNKCMNVVRKRQVRTVSLDELSEQGFTPAAPAPEVDPTEEQLAVLRELLPQLPPKYREIIELRYSREYAYKELAAYLGISMNAVKSRLFHARQALIQLLGQRERD